jgi:cytochrome c553
MKTMDKIRDQLIYGTIVGLICLAPVFVSAGPYRDSAHGNADYGVNRTNLDGRYAEYATGNCAHCHEMHASLEGTDPLPSGGPSAYALFAPGFNDDRTQGPYLEADNFCFSCHSETTGQMVRNQDYSTTFGGGIAGTGPQSIMTAFNQTSYHNLYDIKIFLNNSLTYGPWFSQRDNPCSACHDSHRARRNWDNSQPGFPLLSAISRPGDGQLWGETQVMAGYFDYEAPYAFAESREPGGVGQQDGDNTPDYVTFCGDCHNADTDIWSTTLNRNLKRINWDDIGLNQDKHGKLTRDGAVYLREPYAIAAAVKTNFVLSCLDCHEPHGSDNIMLLRARMNGEDLGGQISSTTTLGLACARCHQDDLAATSALGSLVGTGETGRWQYVHHQAPDAPYVGAGQCGVCHGPGGGSSPIDCGNCHGHGMTDSWAPTGSTGRISF